MHRTTAKLLRSLSYRSDIKYRIGRLLGCTDHMLLETGSAESCTQRRWRRFKNAYCGETAYILSCGPSIDEIWNKALKRFLRNRLVISIKQTYDLAPEIMDFHLYNEIRMRSYRYNPNTIRVSCSQFDAAYPSHLHFPIRRYRYDNAVFATNEYAKWDLDFSYERPWGVGIMFELGLFFPVYLGCSRIVIMGFDMNANGKYHFYDDAPEQDSVAYHVDREEFEYARSSIPHYLKWAKGKGVEVRLYSPLSALPIPQIEGIEAWA